MYIVGMGIEKRKGHLPLLENALYRGFVDFLF
jgi:hypothetical protein